MGCDGCQSDPFQWRSILHSRCLSFIKQCRIFPQSSDHNFDDGACIFPFCSRFGGQFLFFLISSTCLCDAPLPSHLYLKQLRAARMPTATALAQRQLRPFRAWVKSSMNNSLSCCWRSWGYLAMGGGSDGCFPSSPKSWWVCKT